MAIEKGYCVCDERGKLVFCSKVIISLYPADFPPESLFDIDENFNKKDWKNHLKKLQKHNEIREDRSIGPSSNSHMVTCTSHLFYVQSTLLVHLEFMSKADHQTGAESNIDHLDGPGERKRTDIINSPQYLLEFDESGMILNQSSVISALVSNKSSDSKQQVSDYFIEYTREQLTEDIGQIRKGKTIERRLILKGKERQFIDGYGTLIMIRKEPQPNYLLFFRINESIRTLQEQLEKAREHIKKLENEENEQELLSVHQPIEEFTFENIVTSSEKYKNILAQVAQVADTDTTVLITGETGTGKELLANALYKLSDREDMPFVKVNCAVFTKELIESTLFGHEKGAFTGATDRKIGYFEKADKGTIFLDEVGELTLDSQVKLLRVLQSGEFIRVGGTDVIKVDVRVIAATNRNLPKLIGKKEFREDLYYRLNVFPIYNIPLRERREDIPLLVEHFMKKYSHKMGKRVDQLKKSDLKMLQTYKFPGNIRELENIVERAIILSTENVLALSQAFSYRKSAGTQESKFLTFEEAQKKHIMKAVSLCDGKITGKGGAAELLKINGKTLVSKMRKLGLK